MSFYFGFNSPEEREKRRKADLQAIGEKVTSFFWDIAPEHGFELREGQQDMSFEIVDALIHNQHFAVEAGVGIGKSYGYLVPVLLYNKKTNKPVIVATSTIALQEQLWNDVHDIMPLLSTKPEVILAKGQTHYLCHKRANEYLNTSDSIIPQELADGVAKGFEERKQFPTSLQQNIWDKVNIQRFSMRNCGSCEKKCLYYAIRSQLRYTDGIVLCNQDFLTAHLRQVRRGLDGLINREADLIVVDEAHNLDDKVRSATTERINQGKLLGLIKSATNEVKPADRQNVYQETNDAQKEIRTFFDCLKAQVQHQINDAKQAFIEQGVQRLIEVLDISGGKALVLFTAKSDMEEVYAILSQRDLPYKILMQQSGSSQDQVLNEFKENTDSVLLGTGAYWEGISIEGKSLSNVVIFRLPFPVPDPIINYKASIAKDALMDVNVPEMVIKLKQGIGRLIRNFTDTGIVCIIDRRLRDEPAERYHDITWSSLPIKNRTKSLDELRRFYNSLPAAHNETEG